MLEPDQRALLVDALRPPPGMTLDRAVGTTFSLDLEALLVAPLTFALFDARLAEDGSRTDPLSILEAVRRHATHIDVFCQAGQISLPKRYQPIVAHLEESVHPVTVARPQSIFHPKVWVLRFVGTAEDSTAYRLLVLSRNLTFSTSWDTVVQLDGAAGEPDADLATQNAPLVALVSTLPALAVHESSRWPAITHLADELSSVRWDTPEGLDDLSFLTFGIGGRQPTLPAGDRMLAVAPFASASRLSTLATGGRDVLVSRPETLDRISGGVLRRFDQLYVLSPNAADADLEDSPARAEETLAERVTETLIGLHAKLYIAEIGDRATIVTGSPNATDAAFGGNVEFAVAFTGARRRHGIDAFLGEGAEHQTMQDLLEPYLRAETEPIEPTDADRVAVELEEIGRRLAGLAFTLTVEPENDTRFSMRLTVDQLVPDLGSATLHVWPISRKPAAEPMRSGRTIAATYTGFSLQALTSFLALELTAPSADGDVTTLVVVNARLVGAPEDRHQRILTDLLKTKSDVLRYLLFLLADMGDEHAAVEAARILASDLGAGDGNGGFQVPLFESMVRALARSPESLDHINRLIDDLQQTEDGRALLPDGLAEVWPAVWEARHRLVAT